MEDRHVCIDDLSEAHPELASLPYKCSFYAVYDGKSVHCYLQRFNVLLRQELFVPAQSSHTTWFIQ